MSSKKSTNEVFEEITNWLEPSLKHHSNSSSKKENSNELNEREYKTEIEI